MTRLPSSRDFTAIPPELLAIPRAHIETYGTTPDGRLFYPRSGGSYHSDYTSMWREARRPVFTAGQAESPLAGRPHDLWYASVSLWLNAGVHAPEVAERAGRSVPILLKPYAKCIDGQHKTANQRIENAPGGRMIDRAPQRNGHPALRPVSGILAGNRPIPGAHSRRSD
jgi:hypothetical protein